MPARLAYRLYQAFWVGLDWLFPPNCGGCGRRGQRWCVECQLSTQVILPPICPNCGQPQAGGIICARCEETPPHYQALRSWAIFGGQVRHALHQLKYGRNIGLGEVMARPMLHLLQATGWQVEVVIPVPLGLARLKERGYNQASMLAWPIAIALNARYRPRALRRERETRSQVGLSAAERRLNMADAFGAQGQWVSDQNVLVVDDVTTSGSTLDACAAALLRAGAAKVYGLTLARAPLRSDGSDQV